MTLALGSEDDFQQEAPTRAPDRVLKSALVTIESTPQRHVRVPWRNPRMNALFRVSAVAAAALAIIFGPLNLLPRGANEVGASPSPAGPRVDRITIGDPADPSWLAADDQSLWVHDLTGLVRVDLATSAVTARVPMYMQYGYAGTGAGSVWQTDFGSGVLLRIDPVTAKIIATIPVGAAPEGVVVTDGAVWVAERHDGTVTRVDPATNTVVATIPVGPAEGGGPQQMTVGPNSVYVSVENAGTLVRIDPATNAVGLYVPLGGSVASDGTQVWIGVDAGPNGKPKVVRIDPVSGKTITAVDLDVSGIG